VGVEVFGNQARGFLVGMQGIQGKHHPRRVHRPQQCTDLTSLPFSCRGLAVAAGPRR
jgi:hypothetical protein